jgi:hypothetical protein
LFYEGAKAKKFYRSMISDASAAIQWAFLTRVRADILALLLAQVGGNSLRIRISFQKRRQPVGENVIFKICGKKDLEVSFVFSSAI